MRLLLMEPVAGLGAVGEVVEVSDGYGRNYLLPQRLAVANTPENQKEIKTLRLIQLQREEERSALAERAVKDLKNALLQVKLKAQDDGTLYGSVTQSVVADVVLAAKGYRLEERWIQLAAPIKKIGDYDIVVRLPGDQQTQFKLTVLPEEG
ncbi:MAG: 50S ribosomal protein L9 [Planctomycetes bacterium]|nr:50S ribosomal protein L9 [Planctomycetota bacterium]